MRLGRTVRLIGFGLAVGVALAAGGELVAAERVELKPSDGFN